ncbi:MAG: hypothetical protein JSW11_00865 [Candidatus Heimdallarchaeota archaeon]|nr:MAG: hypothetical protein JSW11_00865 [Candidatus Heimdallarchaeota archaeon]
MKITKEGASQAGAFSNQYFWTDDQLRQVIIFETLVVAFLEGKGCKWDLARSPLSAELDRFKDMLKQRQEDDK